MIVYAFGRKRCRVYFWNLVVVVDVLSKLTLLKELGLTKRGGEEKFTKKYILKKIKKLCKLVLNDIW